MNPILSYKKVFLLFIAYNEQQDSKYSKTSHGYIFI